MNYKDLPPIFSVSLFMTIALILILLAARCNIGKEGLEKVEIPIQLAVSEFGDGTFLSIAHGITVDSNFIYIADSKNKRIVVVDTQFSFVRSIGKAGRGPGEFEHVTHLKTFGDYIYVYDSSIRRISILSKSGIVTRIITPKHLPGLLTPFYIYDSGRILLSAPENQKPIVVLSDSGTLIKEFGEQLPDYDGKIYPLRNSRFIFKTGNQIFALCTSFPFIEKYDEEGNLLIRRDLSHDYEEISNRLKEVEKKYRSLDEISKRTNVFNLFTGADLRGNFIYAALSITKEIDKREINTREILQIDTRNLKIKKVIIPKNKEKESIIFLGLAKSENAIYLGSDEIYKLYYDE